MELKEADEDSGRYDLLNVADHYTGSYLCH